jgi:hypothetical protein
MPDRIDLNGEDGGPDELQDAFRQLEEQQKAAAEKTPEKRPEEPKAKPRPDIKDAVLRIKEQQEEAEREPEVSPWPGILRWSIIGLGVATIVVAVAMLLWPTPMPAPALSPREAVRGFWSALIEENYEGATVFYPSMVDRYGSRKQAALRLREVFREDPPVRISSIGSAEAVPDSDDTRVGYEIFLRSGRPRTGEAIISGADLEESGYVIISGI